MKKQFLAAAVMVLLPLSASASTAVATYQMAIDASNFGNDYDIDSSTYSWVSGTPITLADDNSNYKGSFDEPLDYKEIFCVSNDPLVENVIKPYSFYKITDITFQTAKDPSLNMINFITWTANWGASASKLDSFSQENDKKAAQQSLWYYLGIDNTWQAEQAFNAMKIRFNSDTANQGSYSLQWLVAVQGVFDDKTCPIDGQDFLVKASPVPVPSTLLLLGSGLTGLVAAGRRRKQR